MGYEPGLAGTASAIDSGAPDWDLVPFDVQCARCGHDLRGLGDAVCPACKLGFDWSVAVPIEELTCLKCDYHQYGLTETRCPECGTEFTWRDALNAFYRKERSHFEYRWREGPIRSLVRTWFLTLRPKRFWSRLDMQDPPKLGPMLCFGLATAVLFLLGLVTFGGLLDWSWLASRAMRRFGSFNWASVPRLPLHCLDAAKDSIPYLYLEHVLLWWCCTFLALLVFQQSMRRCKLRTVHVVRITIFAQFPILPITAAAALTAMTLNIFGVFPRIDFHRWFILAAALFVLWSLYCGYARYAKMKHAVAVVMASQIIALLAVDMISGWIHGKAFTEGLLVDFSRLLRISL